MRILEEGAVTSFDLGEINGTFFTYVAAVGSYADIPYVTPRKYKKRLGRLAYYFVAVKEAFVPKRIPVHVVCDGKAYDLKVPFLLLLWTQLRQELKTGMIAARAAMVRRIFFIF